MCVQNRHFCALNVYLDCNELKNTSQPTINGYNNIGIQDLFLITKYEAARLITNASIVLENICFLTNFQIKLNNLIKIINSIYTTLTTQLFNLINSFNQFVIDEKFVGLSWFIFVVFIDSSASNHVVLPKSMLLYIQFNCKL